MACLGLVSCKFLLPHPSCPEKPQLLLVPSSFLDALCVSDFCHGCLAVLQADWAPLRGLSLETTCVQWPSGPAWMRVWVAVPKQEPRQENPTEFSHRVIEGNPGPALGSYPGTFLYLPHLPGRDPSHLLDSPAIPAQLTPAPSPTWARRACQSPRGPSLSCLDGMPGGSVLKKGIPPSPP